MSKYPHVPAAFINVLAESSTKTELIQYLQDQWNETCWIRNRLKLAEEKINLQESALDSLGISLNEEREEILRMKRSLRDLGDAFPILRDHINE